MSEVIRATVGNETRVFFEQEGIRVESVDFYKSCKINYLLKSDSEVIDYMNEDDDVCGINWENIDEFTNEICEDDSILFHAGEYDININGDTSQYHSFTVAESSLEDKEDLSNIKEPDLKIGFDIDKFYSFLKSVESVSKYFVMTVDNGKIEFTAKGNDKHNTEIEYSLSDYQADSIENQSSKYLVSKLLAFISKSKRDDLRIGIHEGSDKNLYFECKQDMYEYEVSFANISS